MPLHTKLYICIIFWTKSANRKRNFTRTRTRFFWRESREEKEHSLFYFNLSFAYYIAWWKLKKRIRNWWWINHRHYTVICFSGRVYCNLHVFISMFLNTIHLTFFLNCLTRLILMSFWGLFIPQLFWREFWTLKNPSIILNRMFSFWDKGSKIMDVFYVSNVSPKIMFNKTSLFIIRHTK